MQQFLEFIDRKQREANKHLRVLESMLRKSGMQVKDHIDEDDPYIFVKATDENLSFDNNDNLFINGLNKKEFIEFLKNLLLFIFLIYY